MWANGRTSMPRAPEVSRRRQLLVRADASRTLGAGHLMRTLAIADEVVHRGFDATFFMYPAQGDLRDLVRARGHSVVAVEEMGDPVPLRREPHSRRAAWLLVDHYSLDGTWEREARRVAAHIVAIDDLADRPHTADVVIDPNLDATDAKYRDLVGRRTALLLGPTYVPLRPEFAAARRAVGPVSARVSRIVVSMGGADPGNATALGLAAALEAVPEAHVHVIAGPSFAWSVDDRDPRVHVHRSPPDMASLLVGADLVVGAAGTSALERGCLGIPSVVLQLADNQAEVAAALARHGMALDLGWAANLDRTTLARAIRSLADDPERRSAMREAGMRRVDGLGAVRIANLLDGVRLRRARWSDRMLLWRWANDPQTRRFSTSTAPIPIEDHLEWLRGNLADPRVDLVIAMSGLGPVGILRLAPGWRGELEVSINVDPQHRGGIGTLMLGAAVERWGRRFPGRVLVARIKPGNVASERAFARTGFQRVGEYGETFVYIRPATTVALAGGQLTQEVFP
ncbi:MAG TPA: UDP-2,4-diacetamido-2,4,6-trideoxy-beta-L-altropyranose hydrolase [Candidatus Limnocylindrales bacterium]